MYCVLGVDLVPIEVRRVSEPLEQVVVMGCWRLNHGPLQEEKALLTAEPNPYILNFLNEVTYYCVYVCA